MIGNTWYDPVQRRNVACAADPGAASVAFGGVTGSEHQGPRALVVPAFADELRLQSRRLPRILSISLKARSAVGLGGHGGPGTMVLWEEDNGTWATSDAYTKTPWPEVDEYVRAHPVAAAYGQTWTRTLPESSYLFDDDGLAENAPGQWKRTFPHVLDSPSGKPDNAFITNWEHSPWSDAYMGDMAIALSAKLKLGQEAGTDMLAISFSALDLVGHEYGPRSHEIQDVLVRLDQVVGRLLDALDRSVGADRYVARALRGPRRGADSRAGGRARHERRTRAVRRYPHRDAERPREAPGRRHLLRRVLRDQPVAHAGHARSAPREARRDRRREGRAARHSGHRARVRAGRAGGHVADRRSDPARDPAQLLPRPLG